MGQITHMDNAELIALTMNVLQGTARILSRQNMRCFISTSPFLQHSMPALLHHVIVTVAFFCMTAACSPHVWRVPPL